MPGTSNLYIGLMSGTSVDGIDAALVRFEDNPSRTEILATHEHPFPRELRDELHRLIDKPHSIDLDHLGHLHRRLGQLYAEAVFKLMESASVKPQEIAAIGNHGQTIRHRPDASPPFTLQLGDAATIANICGITTVADFRSADIALGGQGAPLAPAFHQWAFGGKSSTGAVINIGGIANITVIEPDEPLLGYDTGPGNTLLDLWFRKHKHDDFDVDGKWATTGEVLPALLTTMLADPYFKLPHPKSTGREYFNDAWLKSQLDCCGETGSAADIQATLTELTACTIAAAVRLHQDSGTVWLCGGGALNPHLCQRLVSNLAGVAVETTAALGIEPAWVEAATFAWLARERLLERAAGPATVTGANAAAMLGAVYLPPKP